jgi:hypothetical protein
MSLDMLLLRLRLIIQTAIGFIWGLRHRLELLCIVYPIEGLQRLWYHLDPRIYSERLRIRRVSEGRSPRQGNRYVLFVFYGRDAIPAFTQTVIDAIARRGLNLVISTNAKITPVLRQALLEKSCLLIERADLGRDFGGYKDGISIIQQRFGTPDRLILLNDSLFFFEKGLDELIAALDGDSELIGMCEDLHLYYHIQSFALSFGHRVLSDRRFQLYWRKFRSISTRRWAIGKGERGLTRQLLRAGFKPRIIYSAAQLIAHLRACASGELLEAVRLLPAMAREPLFQQLGQLRIVKTSMPLPVVETLSRSVRRLQRMKVAGAPGLHSTHIRQILTFSRQSLVLHEHHEKWASQSIGDSIAALIADRNQIHFGGFLFLTYLGMPAIKRDLFFRELYSLDEIDEHLMFLPDGLKEEIMADCRQKGTARLLGGLSKILYRHGSI